MHLKGTYTLVHTPNQQNTYRCTKNIKISLLHAHNTQHAPVKQIIDLYAELTIDARLFLI